MSKKLCGNFLPYKEKLLQNGYSLMQATYGVISLFVEAWEANGHSRDCKITGAPTDKADYLDKGYDSQGIRDKVV